MSFFMVVAEVLFKPP